MRTTYQRRGTGFSRSRRFGTPNTRTKNYNYEWSETDLIKSIEYSKKAVASNEAPKFIPVNSFDSFDIHPQIKRNIKTKRFEVPSPVQDTAIPNILAGRDVIGIANTGTGKTAAYLIPLIHKACKDRRQKILVIVPTRELAEQIHNDFRDLSLGIGINSAVLIGGAGVGGQIYQLRRNPDFVVATPGRLKDMINRRLLDLSEFNNVVLDETDRMVDIGFLDVIKQFISMLPVQRQSLFFSATISKKVQEIIAAFVKDPVVIDVKKSSAAVSIKQDIVSVDKRQNKIDALHNLLIKDGFSKVIVFGNTKRSVQRLSDELVDRGFKADAIHGDKRQSQRHSILNKFKREEIRILLATDVAARGLDISNVSHVINYELPKTYDDYVHRIGRTGRADKTGVALTFVNQ